MAVSTVAPVRLRTWRAAQAVGILALALLIAGLIARPAQTLPVLWNVLIPMIPASLLVSPALWRNVCPLATLNTLSRRHGKRRLEPATASAIGAAGIALLVVLVPARRFVFNTGGAALAITIVAVGVAAAMLGVFFDLKAGFCNAICPVLPIERLYGQRPLATLGNPRCQPCTLCTPLGCVDLAPGKSIAQVLGTARRSRAWLLTGFGAFGAAFPGFVVGYYTTADGPIATAGWVYGHVAVWMLASYLVTAATLWLLPLSTERAFAILAALAAGLYYWFAAPLVAGALRLPDGAVLALRAAAFGLIGVWLWRASVGVRERWSPAQRP